MQKKDNRLSQKFQKAKDSESDMEKQVKQLTQHLKESVLKEKVLQQEKDQAGAHFTTQEKNMQAKICSLQDEKNEIKVREGGMSHFSISLHLIPTCNLSGFPLIAGLSAKEAGGSRGNHQEAVDEWGRCRGEQAIPARTGGGAGPAHQRFGHFWKEGMDSQQGLLVSSRPYFLVLNCIIGGNVRGLFT